MENESLQKLKAFEINRINDVVKIQKRMEEEQKKFFAELAREKSQNDFLTVNDLKAEYGFSGKTIYRYKDSGLKVHQNGFKGKITVKRSDFESFIKKESYGRFN